MTAASGPAATPGGPETRLQDLAVIIRRQAQALRSTTERDLQESLADLFAAAGLAASREKALGPRDRPDFLLDGGIAVEVKVNGTAGQLEVQIRRYLEHPQITGVLVVTTRARHRALPATAGGKPVRVAWVVNAF